MVLGGLRRAWATSPLARWKSHICLWGSHLNTIPELGPSQLAHQHQLERLAGVFYPEQRLGRGEWQREGPGWQQVLDAMEE